MLTWTTKYLGAHRVEVGMKGEDHLFTIYEDAQGYPTVQGYGKYAAYRTRHTSVEGAKTAALTRMNWGKN